MARHTPTHQPPDLPDEELLPEGHTSVGYEVHVRHMAPAAPDVDYSATDTARLCKVVARFPESSL